MDYQKPTQEEMMQPRYAGDGRPNYEEPQKLPNNFVSGDRSQPYYMYHKDRYTETR